MATGTGKVLCRYFMSGCCKNGHNCTFSHEWTDKQDMTCRYYMKGRCYYGDDCRYDHVRLKESYQSESKKSVASPVSRSVQSTTKNDPGYSNGASTMVTLTKDPSKNPKKWVQAAEFVPGKVIPASEDLSSGPETGTYSYSDVAATGTSSFLDVISIEEAASLLCPFAEMGQCPFGESCEYLHGIMCDMCNKECLNPFDPEQQKAHQKECLEMHEREMERAFQAQESEGKKCAICMEYISGKMVKSEQRFGILPNCEHCFCLSCIRKWRQSTHTQKRTIRACPLCRTVSYFVIPSEVWIEDKDMKYKLIDSYKGNLGKKHCKYFNMGKGTCSFGSSCFYKHEYPDGTLAKDEPRFFTDAEGTRKPIRANTLWEFLSDREDRPFDVPRPTDGFWDESSDDDEVPRVVLEEIFGDRDWFWLTYEPDADELDDLM